MESPLEMPEATELPSPSVPTPRVAVMESPLEMPEATELPSPPVPTPCAGFGAVVGQLLTPGPGGEPYLATLYLGRAVPPSQPDYPPVIAFSEDTHPQAVQDADTGVFVFTDVLPGTYALVIWTPVANTVVQDPETEATLLFEVTAGEISDLGVVPIP